MEFQKKYRYWMLVSIVTTLLAIDTVMADQQSNDLNVAQPARIAATNADRIDTNELERLKRMRINEKSSGDIKKAGAFTAKSWYVPPPPPPTPPPTPLPTPTAPPLPFTFLGQMQESQGKLTIFLANGNQVYLVTQGETIDNTYSVDGIVEGKLGFTYLPLKTKQYLSVGETP